MSNSTRKILMIGLPSTGKTSYLAALWHMVNQSEVACQLFLKVLDGDSGYLNLIKQRWLEYQPVPRNQADTQRLVRMLLQRRTDGQTIALTIPDLSGEEFRLQWSERHLSHRYRNALSEACGAMMFLHPDRIVKPRRIIDINDMEDVAGETGVKEAVEAKPAKKWDIETAPTQVKMTELLQFIAGSEDFKAPFRIAVVVSAWDLLAKSGVTPEKWITKHLPLFRQFLEANRPLFDASFFGVSAQGAKYASPQFLDSDFKDAEGFVAKLLKSADAVSAWLFQQLDAQTRAELQKLGDKDVSLELRSMLAKSLNRILSEENAYEPVRFSGVRRRAETTEILEASSIQRDDNLRLNRLLLEDAYEELSKMGSQERDQETVKLQSVTPSRRISVVGSNVSNGHDVTEPIQWLM